MTVSCSPTLISLHAANLAVKDRGLSPIAEGKIGLTVSCSLTPISPDVTLY